MTGLQHRLPLRVCARDPSLPPVFSVSLFPSQIISETVPFVFPGLINSTYTSKIAETRGILLSQISVAFCVSRAHNTAGTFM